MSELLTSGDIANKLQVNRDRVNYAIRTLGIESVQQAGIVHLYSPDIVKKVRQFIKERSGIEEQGNQKTKS